MAARRQGPVEAATRAELRRLGVSVQSEALPAAAVSLARQMDLTGGAFGAAAGMSGAALAGQLRLIMADVAKTAVRPDKDGIDELNARRAVRRAAEG